MQKKLFLAVILGLLMVFGFVFISCDNGSTSADTWSNVTSLEQLNGTWNDSYSATGTLKQLFESQGETWTDEMQTTFGNMNVTANPNSTFIFSASAGTGTFSVTETMVFSGGNIGTDTVWGTIISTLNQWFSGDVVISFDDASHSVTMNMDGTTQSITDDDLASSGVQINQDGTKIKGPEGRIFTRQ